MMIDLKSIMNSEDLML
jgi:hypothetical protein